MKTIIRIAILLSLALVTAVVAQTDTAAFFAADLRGFMATRAAGDPMKRTPESWNGDMNAKESAVFSYRDETMKLYKKNLKSRCEQIAFKLGKDDLRRQCAVTNPAQFDALATAMEKQ